MMPGRPALAVLPFEDTQVFRVAAEPPRLVLIDGEQAVATWCNVIVEVWRQRLSVDGVARALAAASIALASPPEGFGIVHVFPEAEWLPHDEFSLTILKSLASDEREIHGVGLVALGVRSLVHEVEQSLVAAPKIRVFSTVEESADWLCPILRRAGALPMTSAELSEAINMLVPHPAL